MALRTDHEHKQRSDEELIFTFRDSGDTDVLGVLYERYIELVYGTCLKYLKDAHLSEDAAMSIFESLHLKLKTHEIEHFRGWLYVLSKNYCLQHLRKHNPILTQAYDQQLVHIEDSAHPDDRIILEHRENGLRDCLSKLPDRQKQSLELFYYESKSYEEIAAVMSMKKDRIRSFIQNGRRNLKLCMEKNHGIDKAE